MHPSLGTGGKGERERLCLNVHALDVLSITAAIVAPHRESQRSQWSILYSPFVLILTAVVIIVMMIVIPRFTLCEDRLFSMCLSRVKGPIPCLFTDLVISHGPGCDKCQATANLPPCKNEVLCARE